MSDTPIGLPLNQLRMLFSAGAPVGLSDAQLLERFTEHGDQAAFEALVHRHGPMVLAVCRNVLKEPGNAHDAFQSTFLVLVRKARSLWVVNGSLGSWLYRVAYRIAIGTNAAAARRRAAEKRAGELVPEAWQQDPADDSLLLTALHEEIGLLAEKYRAPIVLCHLEQMTHAQAARQLGWTTDQVRGRVARARDVLGRRLRRRGLTLSGGLLVTLFCERAAPAAIPRSWIEATTAAAIALAAGKGTTATQVAIAHRPLGLGRLSGGAALLTAICVGVSGGLAGARWLAPQDDPDARMLALASRIELARPTLKSTLAPRSAPAPTSDHLPPPARGYQWVGFMNSAVPLHELPGPLWAGLLSGSIVGQPDLAGMFYLDEGEAGDLVVTICHSVKTDTEGIVSCRPVLLDEQRNRYLPTLERSTECRNEVGDWTAIDRFHLRRDLLPPDQLIDLGIEGSTRQRHPAPARFAATPAARRSAEFIKASPGCSWVIPPRPLDNGDWAAQWSGPDGGVVCDVSMTRSGVLAIHLAYQSRTLIHNIGGCVEEYRAVIVDRWGKSHRLTGTQRFFAGQSGPEPRWIFGPADTASFRLELGPVSERTTVRFPISPSDVKLVGVERLSQAALRDQQMAAFMSHIRAERKSFEEADLRWRLADRQSARQYSLRGEYPYINHRVAWLGAFELLQSHLGLPTTTPEALRSARIDDFVMHMKREEFQRGPLFTNWVDPTLVYAYELARTQQSSSLLSP
jgi:RNA polymerase sigma factor (sigma-70 family)